MTNPITALRNWARHPLADMRLVEVAPHIWHFVPKEGK
jgi:hypothetical protein